MRGLRTSKAEYAADVRTIELAFDLETGVAECDAPRIIFQRFELNLTLPSLTTSPAELEIRIVLHRCPFWRRGCRA